jgi:HSP20 family molecular chaperone IbpA
MFDRSPLFHGVWNTGGFSGENDEVVDHDDKYEMIFDVAGYSKDEVDVTINEDKRSIQVTAEKDVDRDESYIHSRLSRSLNIPSDALIDEESIEADYNNGLLSVMIPKEEEDDGFNIMIH